jgi:transcription antitermination factor NusG
MKVMIPEQEPSCEFRPGDPVQVIDGTFVGLRGRVIGVKEAQELWASSGGQQPGSHTPAVCVWVALSIFSRPVPVMLVRDQIRHITA